MIEKKKKGSKESSKALSYVLKRYAMRYKKYLFFAVLSGVVAAATAGFGIPFMISQVFPIVFDISKAPAAVTDFAISLLGEERLEATFLWAAVLFLPFMMGLRGIATYINTYLLTKAGMGMLASLRQDLFARLQEMPMAYLDSRRRGEWMTYVLQYTQNIQQSLISILNDLVIQPLTLLAAVAYLTYAAVNSSQVAALLVNLLIVIICVPLVRYVGKKIIKMMAGALNNLGMINATIEESLTNQREVRAFNLQDRQTRLLRDFIRTYSRLMIRFSVWRQALSPAIEIICTFGLSFALFRGSKDGLTLEQFSAIAAAFYFLYEPVKRLGTVINQMQVVSGMLEMLYTFIEQRSEMPEPENPTPIGKRAKGDITFKDVSFAYQAEEYILQDINVHIPAGQTVALVGPSGAGKTSFINLVCRFYDINKGELHIDGIDIRQLSRHDRMRSIALVSQFPALFRGSVRDNIRVGAPDANDAEVEEAGRQALVTEFAEQKDSGYDFMLAEGGGGLSGGQKQRVSIARAILKNAPIIILDEATSALDTKSEARIQEALESLTEQQTCFIIAHRFSTIRKADRILLFEQGRIVGDGTHQELYENSHLYKRLYDEQVSTEKEQQEQGKEELNSEDSQTTLLTSHP